MEAAEKEIQTRIVKGNLDLIILKSINQQPMHGYQLITKILKTYKVHFAPSVIYPLLTQLEQKEQLTSTWNTTTEKPRKIYTTTPTGKNTLKTYQNILENVYTIIHTLK